MSREYTEVEVPLSDIVGSLSTGELREPDEFIATGIVDGSFAQELHIWYAHGNTYVVTVGEYNNAPPHYTEGHVTPEEAVDDYLAEVKSTLEYCNAEMVKVERERRE